MKTNFRIVLFLIGVLLIVCNSFALAHTNVTALQARDLIDSTDDLIVLDVRELSEYCGAKRHIQGALNYPWNSGVLQARYEELPMDVPVLVVCGSGGRSNSAANFLDSKNFSIVYDMLGGMSSWIWETVPCVDPDAKYGGGTGDPNDPYQIATAEDLMLLGEMPEDYDKHFILTADIDLDPNLPGRKVFDRAVIAPDTEPNDEYWPFQGTAFTGVFDGNAHTISNLTIKGKEYLGLFGQLKTSYTGFQVKNLGLVDVNITGSGDFIGGLVGYNDDYFELTNCYSTGSVTGDHDVGGLVGINWGILTHCYSTGTVRGFSNVGGVVGKSGHYVAHCCSTGSVVVTGWEAGGLVGQNTGIVTQCYSSSKLKGNDEVGGLIGRNEYGAVIQCYCTGLVEGNSRVGGLVGNNSAILTQCYSTGLVSGSHDVGGLVGENYLGTVTGCFWDIQTSGQTTSVGGTGKTAVEMQDIRTYLEAGWDFIDETANGTCQIWDMPQGGGYPVLTAFNGYTPPHLKGKGTAEDPYVIFSAADLGAIAHYGPAVCYRLETSVDLAGICWGTAVVPYFAGRFDGNGNTIAHLTILSGSSLGLFGNLSYRAEVWDLGVVDVNVTGSGHDVGGLVGMNHGTVTNCYSTGMVSGSDYAVGGLVGHNWASVTHCHSADTVSGTSAVGGLVGWNRSIVAHCYSTGAVTGSFDVGGLVGRGYWSDTFPPRPRHTVTGSFWDVQTSGQATSIGGTGKTTAEMQTAGTFLDAGWDFVDEMANGTEDIWWIDEGRDYPRLWWELIPDEPLQNVLQ